MLLFLKLSNGLTVTPGAAVTQCSSRVVAGTLMSWVVWLCFDCSWLTRCSPMAAAGVTKVCGAC